MKAWILLLIVPTVWSSLNEDISYLEELISNNTRNALTIKLPVDAREFESENEVCYTDYGTFDFIVIGGGVGGCVVANRLSDMNRFRTLLIEAGTWEDDFINIPGMYGYAKGTKYNWNFKSTPQKHACLGMKGRQCLFPRGKGFGGTSLINGLNYVRGSKADYNIWEEKGNPDWGYDKILKYFIKSENSSITEYNRGYHGFGGPLHTQFLSPLSKHVQTFLEASEELGYKVIDYNGRTQVGVARSQSITTEGQRLTHARAFVTPVRSRRNLLITEKSFATKILIDKVTKRATAVMFSKNGRKYKARVSREVIVCAGPIITPQILMLSGIGSKKDLLDLKIKPLVDLPVGKNLHDHPAFIGLNIHSKLRVPYQPLRELIYQYLVGFGLLTYSGSQGLGFFRTKYGEITTRPDLEILLAPPNRTNPYFQKNVGYNDKTYKAATENIADQSSTFTFTIACLHPKGIGEVKLGSNDPYEYPLIDAQFLSHPQDVAVILEGVRMVQRMLKTKPFRKINARMSFVDHPACRKYKPDSDHHWHCLIRHMTHSLNHGMGTAKMAPQEDGGVLDPHLKVYGIENLRVGDSSAIPYTHSGHPVAATTMIAEKLSDMIKVDHGGFIENCSPEFS